MKRNYMKPAMRVVTLQHQHHILAGSPVVRGLGDKGSEKDIDWKDGGFGDGEDDM